jgi:hypothetical protein
VLAKSLRNESIRISQESIKAAEDALIFCQLAETGLQRKSLVPRLGT